MVDKAERSEAVVVVVNASSSDSEDELRLLLWTVLQSTNHVLRRISVVAF